MKKTYRNSPPAVTPRAEEMPRMLEDLCREKLSELFQAVLEAEVDAALERLRYERRSGETKQGYRDGHDRSRTITSNRGQQGFQDAILATCFVYRCASSRISWLPLSALAWLDAEGPKL